MNDEVGTHGSAEGHETSVPLLDPDDAAKAAAEVRVPEALASLNVFRLLLRRPRLAKGVADLLLSLLFGADLEARLRELIIMRVAWLTASEYEWAQHWRIAIEAGVSEADLLGVRDWAAHPGFGPEELTVLAATDEAIASGVVSRPTLAGLRRSFGDDAALEVVASIGAWTMVSTILRSLDVPLEEGVTAWPPDGLLP